jgi:Tol biopolymer transport system component
MRSRVAPLLLAIVVVACGGPSGSASQAAQPSAGGAPSSAATPSVLPTEEPVVGAGEEWLAYQWLDATGDGIYLARPDGSGLHQILTGMAGSEIHPDWSPDGQRIAFVRFTPEDQSELWVVNADGGGEELLASCERPCNSYGYPDWNADGSRIYFSQDANAGPSGVPSTFQIARLDMETREVEVVLTRQDTMTAEQPRISPDETQLVYTRFRSLTDAFAGSAIFVADLEGGPEQRLTEWDAFGASPDWSPDGTRIVFNTFDLGAFQDITTQVNLFTIRPDGSDIQRLTDYGENDTRATQPRYAPDGSGIVYTQVQGAGFGTRTAALLPLDGSPSPWADYDPITATHPTLRPIP